MSRGGVVVDRVVACPGTGSGQAAETLVALVGASGEYHAVRVAADRVQFARTFRPTWATVLGWCLLPVLLIGIVFFFVKTTETCVAVVEADHRGTRIRLSGRLEQTVLQRLVTSFDDPVGAARDAAQATAVGAPVAAPAPAWPAHDSAVPFVSAPAANPDPALAGSVPPMAPPTGAPLLIPPTEGQPVHDGPPMPPPAAPPHPVAPGAPPYAPVVVPDPGAGPAPVPSPHLPPPSVPTPVDPQPPGSSKGWVPVWEREEAIPPSSAASAPLGLGFDPSSTIVTPHRRMRGAPGLRAVLDDGTELDLSSVVLLGRDPAAGPGDREPTLVPVADPERSVSKTHLRVEVLGGVVLATDRGSTNGSVIIGPDGRLSRLDPGVATEVPAGSELRFGSRSVRVLTATPTGGSL